MCRASRHSTVRVSSADRDIAQSGRAGTDPACACTRDEDVAASTQRLRMLRNATCTLMLFIGVLDTTRGDRLRERRSVWWRGAGVEAEGQRAARSWTQVPAVTRNTHGGHQPGATPFRRRSSPHNLGREGRAGRAAARPKVLGLVRPAGVEPATFGFGGQGPAPLSAALNRPQSSHPFLQRDGGYRVWVTYEPLAPQRLRAGCTPDQQSLPRSTFGANGDVLFR